MTTELMHYINGDHEEITVNRVYGGDNKGMCIDVHLNTSCYEGGSIRLDKSAAKNLAFHIIEAYEELEVEEKRKERNDIARQMSELADKWQELNNRVCDNYEIDIVDVKDVIDSLLPKS